MEEDYSRNLIEFDSRFSSEEGCHQYLRKLRWPEGFICPKCQCHDAWTTRRNLLVCAQCQYQASLTAGTIFQDTRTPLTVWFKAIWWVTTQKNGASELVRKTTPGKGRGLAPFHNGLFNFTMENCT